MEPASAGRNGSEIIQQRTTMPIVMRKRVQLFQSGCSRKTCFMVDTKGEEFASAAKEMNLRGDE
jgi:hypothetical protein